MQSYILVMTGNDPSKDELLRNFERMDLDENGNINKEECFKFMKGFNIGNILKEILGEQ